MGNESAALRSLEEWATALRPLRFPRLLHQDLDRGLMVTELVPSEETLAAYHRRIGRLPSWIARALGKGLGRLHRESRREGMEGRAIEVFALTLPDPPLEAIADMSPANLELVRIVQRNSGACDALGRLRHGWRATCFVHGDLKGDNCLVSSDGGRHRQLTVTDWETATLGDPGWDVGSIFGEYLTAWVLSIPVVPGEPPDRHLGDAKIPVEAAQRALGEFWRSYGEARGWSRPEATACLSRAAGYAGARLLQTAFEVQREATEMDSFAVCLTQFSMNILTRPDAAIEHLFRLDRS